MSTTLQCLGSIKSTLREAARNDTLTRSVATFSFTRPRDFGRIDEFATLFERHLG